MFWSLFSARTSDRIPLRKTFNSWGRLPPSRLRLSPSSIVNVFRFLSLVLSLTAALVGIVSLLSDNSHFRPYLLSYWLHCVPFQDQLTRRNSPYLHHHARPHSSLSRPLFLRCNCSLYNGQATIVQGRPSQTAALVMACVNTTRWLFEPKYVRVAVSLLDRRFIVAQSTFPSLRSSLSTIYL